MLVELGSALIAPLLRSVGGWAENAFKDGKIERFEILKLGETAVRVLILTAGTFYGLNGMGIDISAFASGMAAVVFDFILPKRKK